MYGRYEKAAKLYAQTEASFEEVALKFMEIKQEDALQAFLLEVALVWKLPNNFKNSMILKKTESITIERRSTDATFYASSVAAGADAPQARFAQRCWNQDGQSTVSKQLGHTQSFY